MKIRSLLLIAAALATASAQTYTFTTLAGEAGFGSDDGIGGAARFSYPSGVAVDGSGNVFVADSGNHTIRKITAGAFGVVTTLAGDAGSRGSADGTGSAAEFYSPRSVAVDGSGTVFVADYQTIRKITAGGGVTTLAGTVGGYGSADGTGSDARFGRPFGVAVDGSGNVFVADVIMEDINNGTIRKISPGGAVTSLAGGALSRGSADGVGSAASFQLPMGIAVDGSGILFVADWGNGTIRKITAAGVVTTFAGLARSHGSVDGTGSAARFSHPSGVAVDGSGNVFVADSFNHTIRKITAAGVVTTFAGLAGSLGSADGAGSAARFSIPSGLAVDGSGNVFVADSYNHTIRKITAAGVVTTVAGLAGSDGSVDGTGSAARFSYPSGVAVDGSGNVFVADRGNHTIRKITAAGVVTTVAGVAGSSGNASGTGSAARFYVPSGVAVDGSGNVFVADTYNHTIRKGVPVESSAPASRLVNFSARTLVPAGGDLTMGFGLRGRGSKSVLVRAVGPTLGSFGVTGALADPRLDLIPAGASIATSSNDDWGLSAGAGDGPVLATVFASAGAFPLPAGSKDAAIIGTLPVAAFTVRVTSAATGGSGLVLAEVYDRDAADAPSRIANVSTLGFAGTGAQQLVQDFVIDGVSPKRLLIRAVGPGLAPFGVSGTLADPQLSVIALGRSVVIAYNNNWDGDATLAAAFVSAGAFALPAGSRDAAIVMPLTPGAYMVTVSGVGDTTGRALVEIYELD